MSETTDNQYKSSLFLPKTEFPMRAGLPKKEPEILNKWLSAKSANAIIAHPHTFDEEKNTLKNDQKKADKPQFTLHDGPPYANGNLHIGHALNKTLKDMVVRSKKMNGYSAYYVPGWDCHGLPIEWQIEEQYRKKGKNKDEVDINTFRDQCRAHASEWVEKQSIEFKRLGIYGDWENRSSKPVYWSCVEKTALADAETEYQNKESQVIWVKFPVENANLPRLSVIIWTTTPWTIPANLALAYGDQISYGIYEVTAEMPSENWIQKGEKFLLADSQAETVFKNARISAGQYSRIQDAENLDTLICQHPLKDLGGIFSYDRRLISADFVTDDAGTGFVHCAPGHGEDDYSLWLAKRELFPAAFHTDLPHTIRDDGGYQDHMPKFWQKTDKYADKENVYILKPNGKEGNANDAVIEALKSVNCLAGHSRITHSYPHSWRSKAPLIYRNTSQWFISMAQNDLRKTALSALEKVTFYPENGRNRITTMIKNRPDWVVSRQRAWGVPLALFVDKKTGHILNDEKINNKIIDIFTQESADAWWKRPASDFFAEFNPDYHEQVFDILDVWFDSGTTHAFVLEDREALQAPADLYLEGSDQHRGWFHSSLLQSCGTRGRAPYKALLTHGFVLDEKGEKMSKSKGNVVTPQEIIKDYGADILRLWVATSDYHNDLRIGKEIIKGTADTYRRLRNSMRWMLGAVSEFKQSEFIAAEEMPDLEQWVLHRLSQIGTDINKYYEIYDFNRVFSTIFNFVTNDLSAFYFDVRKDSLYCDKENSINRRSCRTVLRILIKTLSLWLAPIIPFTADEIWCYLTQDNDKNIHNYEFAYPEYNFPESFERITNAKEVRRVVNGCLEKQRSDKVIGASLEAKPVIFVKDKSLLEQLKQTNFADICIVPSLTLTDTALPEDAFTLNDVADIQVAFNNAEGDKCQRCWKILPEVTENDNNLCHRCNDFIMGS